MRITVQQTSTDILLNEALKELTDCLPLFIQTKVVVLKDLMAKNIIYQKVLSKIIMSLSKEELLRPIHSFWYKALQRN